MPSVKNLKKDINFVLGDIIEAVYIHEMTSEGKPTAATNAVIDEAITSFDALIVKVNAKKVEIKSAFQTNQCRIRTNCKSIDWKNQCTLIKKNH